MSLVLEVEHLTGVAFAAIGPESDAPDWPPEPDRVFSALVASWAARGQHEAETRALQWLEEQVAPQVIASAATPRSAPVSFVPPNDPATGRSGNRAVMPAHRSRQPRRFPAARPDDPVVRFHWAEANPDGETLGALTRVAADAAYLGHSMSLARFFFRTDLPQTLIAPVASRRRVYPGRLAELRDAFDAGRRPSPGDVVRPGPVTDKRPYSVFDRRWLLLEHDADDGQAGSMPDIRAAAIVAKTIRDALLDGYGRSGRDIPEIVSGHTPDGSPSRQPHLAIVPLTFAGFQHSDGRILGFALVPPRDSQLLDDGDALGLFAALREIAPFMDTGSGQRRRVMELRSRIGSAPSAAFPPFRLALTLDPDRRSLRPDRYVRPARTFATVTPIALDRHLKEDGAGREGEMVAQIVSACRNIGLPEPELLLDREGKRPPRHAVAPGKHSAIAGATSAGPSGRAPRWMRWRLPASLASRPLVHAVIRFAQPVHGPVILGAGRYVGLGLCLPVTDEEDQS